MELHQFASLNEITCCFTYINAWNISYHFGYWLSPKAKFVRICMNINWNSSKYIMFTISWANTAQMPYIFVHIVCSTKLNLWFLMYQRRRNGQYIQKRHSKSYIYTESVKCDSSNCTLVTTWKIVLATSFA